MTEKELRKLGRKDLLQMLVAQSREVVRQKEIVKELEISLTEVEENNDHLRSRLDEKDETIDRLKKRLDEKDELILKLFGEDALSLLRVRGLASELRKE